MWPLSKKPKVDTKTKEYPQWRVLGQDFESDDLDSYLSGHTRLVVDEIRAMLPRDLFSHLFIAGGFAAHVAGITTSHGDVDIFCTQDNVFARAKTYLLKHGCVVIEEVDTGYSKAVKLDLNGIGYHLVDATNVSASHDITELLTRFDLNWCMAGINLYHDSIYVHKDSLLTVPKVNINFVHDNPDNLIRRLGKYRDRLKRTPDLETCDRMIQIAKNRAKDQNKNQNGGPSYLGENTY